jgi:hypothetical protein
MGLLRRARIADATRPGRARNDAPFAGIAASYITCWKGFPTMLRRTGGYVGGACFLK